MKKIRMREIFVINFEATRFSEEVLEVARQGTKNMGYNKYKKRQFLQYFKKKLSLL